MDGALWKWTNYMSGWQLRWFVLDVGVLSYYKSQDDIHLGSRGSVKMGCCEVSHQANDPLRINLKIPPDQYIYVKATTAAERQQWLVALGTSKACLTQGNDTDNQKKPLTEPHSEETLHDKMSEMHVCKNILLEQIHSMKNLCKTKEDAHEFQEAATLLSATCDAFLTNLSDCVRLAKQEFTVSPISSPKQSELNNFTTPVRKTRNKLNLKQVNRLTSNSSSPTSPTFNSKPMSPVVEKDIKTEAIDSKLEPLLSSTPPSDIPVANETIALHGPNPVSVSEERAKEISRRPTLFSTSPNRFNQVQLLQDGGIPTKSFLLACNSILPIFDVLGPTAFAPVKLDISGNIKKLTAKYNSNQTSFATLQLMISTEIQSDTCNAKNSATDALLWLKRALQFTNTFLQEIDKGERELVVVASTAYSKTLRKYHGWMVRGVFAMAVKAVPYWKDFVKALGTTDSGIAPELDVLNDIKDFSNTLAMLIDKINEFYRIHKLDSDSTV